VTEPVLMDKAELAKMTRDMAQATEVVDGLKRDLKLSQAERDQARDAVNRARAEADRLRKIGPDEKTQDENKGLRTSVSEAHKRIGALEKDLTAVKAESEARRKEIIQAQGKLSNIQNTFDMMQVGRDKACADRDQALSSVEQAGAAYHKLQGEFEEFKRAAAERAQNEKRPGAAAKAEPQGVKK
jgi:chromosome segregation ATPase